MPISSSSSKKYYTKHTKKTIPKPCHNKMLKNKIANYCKDKKISWMSLYILSLLFKFFSFEYLFLCFLIIQNLMSQPSSSSFSSFCLSSLLLPETQQILDSINSWS